MKLGLLAAGLGDATPSLPTYRTAADVLEKKNGSGVRLVGWTFARMLLIFPPFVAVGVPWRKALAGAALTSGIISLFTLIRIANAGPMTTKGLAGSRRRGSIGRAKR